MRSRSMVALCSSNGHVVRVEATDQRCPWCDGTGRYARTSHDRVPCGYCDATGQRTEVRARYVIAADGANSWIRRRLGIATHGVERIGEYLSILFRADVERIVGAPLSGLYMLHGLGGPAPSVALQTSRSPEATTISVAC